MKRWWLLIAIVVSLEFVGGIFLYAARPPRLPPDIYGAVRFPVLTPQTAVMRIDPASATYDAGTRVLQYQGRAFDGRLTVNQQPAPAEFVATPSKYDDLARSLNQYQTLETHLGSVRLARPKDLGGRQVAVLNAAGTLIFIYPTFDLGAQQWSSLFAGLTLRN
jgi:hypothetical protein